MKIRFWGVRGSIPSPGVGTSRYGGNTSCVEVITKSGESIVLDAGTGIRLFGADYLNRRKRSDTIHIFISHVHWDHIQGFPYFRPAYLADMNIHIYSGMDIRKLLAGQMKPPYFPYNFHDLKSKLKFHVLDNSGIRIAGCRVKPFSLVHPQEAYGFIISEAGRKVVYSSDTENEAGENYGRLIKLIAGVDVLLYDAQYTPEEYTNHRTGWGHSTYEAAADIAKKAGVGKLVLFHHEPGHDDKMVKWIEGKARELFPATIAAREGMVLEV